MPFQSGRTGVTNTFNYNDIATGKSIINHYGARASGAYLLMANRGYSDGTHTMSGKNVGNGLIIGTSTPALDLDFDLEFDRPRVIEGKTLISVPIVIGLDAAVTSKGKVNVIVRKVVGGTSGAETDLVSRATKVVSFTGTSGSEQRHFRMIAVIVDIPRTKFKAGDILRLTCVTYVETGNTIRGGIGHDPKGRDYVLLQIGEEGLTVAETSADVTPASDLQFPIPFVLDI